MERAEKKTWAEKVGVQSRALNHWVRKEADGTVAVEIEACPTPATHAKFDSIEGRRRPEWGRVAGFSSILCLGHIDCGQWKLKAGETVYQTL